MKIGVFDSGLGGLIITKTFLKELGEYDYVYFGDTKNLPYGEKTNEEVRQYTVEAMAFLAQKGCKLIIVACNTASAVALRYLQQVYMPKHYPDIKVLGVVVPTVEEAIAASKTSIGVIATPSTVASKMYTVEIQKITPKIKVFELAAPKLVKLIENNELGAADDAVREYVKSFSPFSISSLILGCTHYPLLKEIFRKHLPAGVSIISQDEFMGRKLRDYLARHPEIESKLSKSSDRRFFVSKLNPHYLFIAFQLIPDIKIEEV